MLFASPTNPPRMQGLHLTADLYDCQGTPELLVCAQALGELCRGRTRDAGLTQVGETWVTFPSSDGRPGGVTGTVLLAESHLAIHTWPELGHVTLDVYVCNFSGDNTERAEQLLQSITHALAPRRTLVNRLRRGELAASPVQAT